MNGRDTISLYGHINRIMKVLTKCQFTKAHNFEKQNPNKLGYTILAEYPYGVISLHQPLEVWTINMWAILMLYSVSFRDLGGCVSSDGV